MLISRFVKELVEVGGDILTFKGGVGRKGKNLRSLLVSSIISDIIWAVQT
jgi:hypothetical protein